MKTLQEMIEESRGLACEEHINRILQYTSIEEASKDPDAPYWILWYCVYIGKIRLPELEEYVKSSERWWCAYKGHFDIYEKVLL